MTCFEFQERLQLLLDGLADVDGRPFEEHRESCRTCREQFAAALAMERGARLLPNHPPPANLSDRVVAQVLADRHARRKSRRLFRAGLTAAACALLAVAGWSLSPKPLPPRAPHEESPAVASLQSASPPVPVPPAEPPPSLNRSLVDASTALASLVSQAAEETVTPGRLLIPEKVDAELTVVAADVWQPLLESTPLALREAGHGVSAGLEPMTDSARRAVNVFLQEMPAVGEAR